MNKRTSAILAILTLLALLVSLAAGCATPATTAAPTTATSGSTSTTTQTTAAPEPVNLRFWFRASSAENGQTIAMDSFNESQSRIKVEYGCYGDNYGDVIRLALISGDAPDSFDVSGIDGGTIRSFAENGYMEPLDSFIEAGLEQEFRDGAFRQYNYGGKLYVLPTMERYMRLWYNKTLFEQAGLDPASPPATLEQMEDYARKITQAGNGQYYGFGLAIRSGSTWERNIDTIATLSGLTGPFAFDYKTGRFDFAKHEPILQFFNKLYKEGLIIPGAESMDIEVVRANFATDKIGMYIDGNWMVSGYNNDLVEAKNLNFDSALIPVFAASARGSNWLTMESGMALYAKSEHKAETFEAIRYHMENLYEASARKYPEKPLLSLSPMPAVSQRINQMENVRKMRGMTSFLEDKETYIFFDVTPHTGITLEGDSRNVSYPLMVIDTVSLDTLNTLSDRYNKALDAAIAAGLLKESDLKPAGFNYR